jgi:hypothetical protein
MSALFVGQSWSPSFAIMRWMSAQKIGAPNALDIFAECYALAATLATCRRASPLSDSRSAN